MMTFMKGKVYSNRNVYITADYYLKVFTFIRIPYDATEKPPLIFR